MRKLRHGQRFARASSKDCDAGPDERVVITREGNHSAFSGYHFTPSNYSQCKCLRCQHSWRTKADYVGALRDATERERFA